MSTENKLQLENHVSTAVNACAFSLYEFEDEEDGVFYNVIAHLMVDANSEDENFELPLITEIYHPTMSGAVFMVYRSAAMFTDNFYDEIPVFNEDGECIKELSLDEIMQAIKQEFESAQEEVPEGATLH